MNLHRMHRPASLGGSGTRPVWLIQRSFVPKDLTVRPDPKKPVVHAMIEPVETMMFDAFRTAIENTGPNWETCSG